MKLSNLIHQLRNNSSPYESFMMYNGHDWKHHIMYNRGKIPFPIILWKSKQMELVLYGWNKHQHLYKYNNFQNSLIKVLHGSIYSSVHKTQLEHKLIHDKNHLQVDPFSTCMLTSNEKSASLHLYQYCYNN
jgi:hypothetical protein